MIGTPITIKNHDTGATVVLNDHATDRLNVIALQSFPSFEADVRNQNVLKQGAHGEYHLPSYYGGMSIVLQGVIVGETEADVWTIKKTLDAVMQMPKYGYPRKYTGSDTFPPKDNNNLRLSFTNPNGLPVFIDATPIKVVSYDRPLQQEFLLNFQVILRANSPYLLVNAAIPVIETGALGTLAYGFKLGTKLPLSLSNEYITNEMTITVPSRSFAIIKMDGSNQGTLVKPKVTNLTNDSYILINKPLSGASNYFEIDGVYQTMTDQNGQSVQAYSEGDYILLETGINRLVYTAQNVIPF